VEIENPDAGWYRDPVDPGRFRYWDGTGWTHQVRTPEVSTALAVVRPEPAAVTTPAPAVVAAAVVTPEPAVATPAPVVSEVAGLYADDDIEPEAGKPKRKRSKLRKSKVEKLKEEREPSRPKFLVVAAVIALAAVGVTAALTFFGGAEEGGATGDGAAASQPDFAAGPARNACIRTVKDAVPGSQNQIVWQPIEGVTHRQVGDQVQVEFWGEDPEAPGDRQRSNYLCVVDGDDVTRVEQVYATVGAPVAD
jgi:hypothetical protein